MRKHGARGLVVALLVVVALGAAAPAGADAAQEARAVSLVNGLRSQVGVPALTVDSRLSAIARRWAGVMASQGAISHNPNVYSEAPSDWQSIGENVGFGPSVDDIYSMWVNSSSHYRNMVDGSFTNIGAGFVESGGYLWGVLVFTGGGSLGAPAPEAVAAAPAAAPVVAEPQAEDAYATDDFFYEEEVVVEDDTPNPAAADDPVTSSDDRATSSDPSDDDRSRSIFGGFGGFGGTPGSVSGI